MAKILLLTFLSVLICASAQRITTIHLDGVQYFISRMNPYSPELNYFLAYQYCRSLGLQLASFETKEKTESMTTYLKNAGYGNYDFWTSGNRLGTGMFLWMSTGLPFNATFDFFENSGDAIQTSLLDANDHNSNTAPQRTARDSSSGSEKGCVILKQPSLKWMPEDCSAVKDFICEQTRCYYYNYGSIPVSSAQGRPITSTTPRTSTSGVYKFTTTTTPVPILMSTAIYERKQHVAEKIEVDEDESAPSFMSLNLANNDSQEKQQKPTSVDDEELDDDHTDESKEQARDFQLAKKPEEEESAVNTLSGEDSATADQDSAEVEVDEKSDTPEVDEHVKQISHKIEKIVNNEQLYPAHHAHFHRQSDSSGSHDDDDDLSRQSFLSLTDLIRTLRPNDKQIIPQIDSDYSNAMRVLGENSGPVVKNDDTSRGNFDFLQSQSPNRGGVVY